VFPTSRGLVSSGVDDVVVGAVGVVGAVDLVEGLVVVTAAVVTLMTVVAHSRLMSM
jgi:hypothetical protein